MPIDATDQPGLYKALFRGRRYSRIGKQATGINNQNRVSVRPYSVYECCPPGQTAQRIIPSSGTGRDIAIQIAAVDDRQTECIGKDIGIRKNGEKRQQSSDRNEIKLIHILPY